jgi:hypothetical protein
VWAAGAASTWGRLARLGGVGYLAAVAACGVVWAQLLVIGVPLRGITVALTLLLLAAGALLVGLHRGRGLPAASHIPATRGALLHATGIGVVAVLLAALFRAGRLAGVQAYDAWAFWLPKAKMIYETGGLDADLLAVVSWPSYPQVVPALDAVAFMALGAEDVVTLTLQPWALAVGLVWAVAGLLAPRAPAWLLWPSLVLVLSVPRLGDRLLMPQADVPLDVFFVVAALALALWVGSRDARLLVLAAVLLSAVVLTKREGLVLAACTLGAAFVSSGDRWRSAWPRLLAVATVVVTAGLPWRLWTRSQGFAGEAPPGGLVSLDGREDRLGPALRLATDVLLSLERWSVVGPLIVLVVVLGGLARQWRLTAFVGTLFATLWLGGAWAAWAFTDIPITEDEAVNPIVRYTGASILLAAAAVPLLLGRVWAASQEQARG